MTIIYRTADAWGAGKGADLTAAEVDGNFYDHEGRIAELEQNPPQAVSIVSIDVTGNQMTVQLTDSTELGPFTIPTSQWNWKGERAPLTVYFANDVFSHDGAIYLVLNGHTSEASFSPDAEGVDGFFYNLMLAQPEQPYDVGMFYQDVVPNDGSIMLQHVATRDFVIAAVLTTAVTLDDLVFGIFRNETQIGMLTFTIGVGVVSPGGGQFGTFEQLPPATEDLEFSRTDRLIVKAPTTPYETPAGLSITIAGRVAAII